VVHANAVLTPRGRLLLARRVVEEGWPIARAAEHFHVSWPTAKRWASRYAAMGEAGMTDRSSRPYRSPNRTAQIMVRKIVHLRWKHRLSPLAIASRLSMPASTVHAVLVRCRLNRLSHIDIRTGEPIRRYEHDHPGALIHVDVKKLGNIPDGGGWRFVGRAQGGKNRRATVGVRRSRSHDPNLGWPTPRSTTTKPPTQQSRSCAGRWAGSGLAASALNVSCPTTADVTDRMPGGIPARNCRFSRSGPAPTDRKPTAR
jgi:leucine-zipper of insertion element IS481